LFIIQFSNRPSGKGICYYNSGGWDREEDIKKNCSEICNYNDVDFGIKDIYNGVQIEK